MLQLVMPVLVILNEARLLVEVVNGAIMKWSVDGDSEPKFERFCFVRGYVLLLLLLHWAAVAHV